MINKITFAVLVISLSIVNCKRDNTQANVIDLNSETNGKVAEDNFIPKCDYDTYNTMFYLKLEDSLKIEHKEFYNIRSFKRFSKEKITSFFDAHEIKCFLSFKGSHYEIVDITYKNNYGNAILDRIIKTHQDKRSFASNDVEAFFKRGIVVCLNEDKSKLTLIFFNPFINPKLVKVLKNYFKEYDVVKQSFMSTGLGTIEEL